MSGRGHERTRDLDCDLERGLDRQRTVTPNESFQGFAFH